MWRCCGCFEKPHHEGSKVHEGHEEKQEHRDRRGAPTHQARARRERRFHASREREMKREGRPRALWARGCAPPASCLALADDVSRPLRVLRVSVVK